MGFHDFLEILAGMTECVFSACFILFSPFPAGLMGLSLRTELLSSIKTAQNRPEMPRLEARSATYGGVNPGFRGVGAEHHFLDFPDEIEQKCTFLTFLMKSSRK